MKHSIGEKVFIYFNLHKKCWSIKNVRTGKVIGHTTNAVLKDCTFKVSEPGRQRVLKEKRKNVHAGVVGILVGAGLRNIKHQLKTAVSYNPYRGPTFFRKTNGSKITTATKAVLIGRVVFV